MNADLSHWPLYIFPIVAALRPLVIPVQRLRFGRVSYGDFYAQGPHNDQPVIISDIPVSDSPCFGRFRNNSNHLLALMAEHCDGAIRLDKMTKDKTRGRTGKIPLQNMDFKVFIELWNKHNAVGSILGQHGPLLGLEKSIMSGCDQEFWETVRIPPFFTGDINLRAKTSFMQYGDDWSYPSLTFSEAGFVTLGHVDNPNNEIWMGMCFGRKIVRIIPVSVVAKHWKRGARLERYAYGRLSHDGRVVLNLAFKQPLDLFDEGFIASMLPGVPIYEGFVEGGDVLYLPTSAVHSVYSEDRGLYVISSYVDLNGLLPPNPHQLPIKMDSCSHRPYLSNWSSLYGGADAIARRALFCERLVSWLLDDRMRVPLVDGMGRAPEAKSFPRRCASILSVAHAGSDRLHQRVVQWLPV